MTDYTKHCTFAGRIVMIGFGSIGQGVLPLILRHIDMDPRKISIITSDDRGAKVAAEYGITHDVTAVTRDNYRALLDAHVAAGDFILNLSVDVSSVALIEYAHEKGALYLDTCIEPWVGVGGYLDAALSPSARSNYALRETALAVRAKFPADAATAVITHGANPGMVSHFVKQALINIAGDLGKAVSVPTDRAGWAALAHMLGIKVVHIAERDNQVCAQPKMPGEFVNTWSIEGFASEGRQPAELGWGAHERHFPADGGRHNFGPGSAIFLNRPGASVRVRTWTPTEGPFHGFLITHGESISISDYYTVQNGDDVLYRPTVHYAYHPCDGAVLSVHELAGKNWELQAQHRLIVDEITDGIDELGVLLAGHEKGAYWFGSQLSTHEARTLCPHNSATSLQVTAGVLAGLVWAIENPNKGVVEPDEMDFARCMEVMLPYLGPVIGAYTDWTPLQDRASLFAEDLDADDPWQFKNVRVI